MAKLGFIISLLLIFFYSACSQNTTSISKSIGNLNLTINSRCFNKCDSAITFLNVHENENTSVQAAEKFLYDNGGTLVKLNHLGTRNLTFKLNKRNYAIDPNRMYTAAGRKESLTALSTYNVKADTEVKSIADEILSLFIDNRKLVVALHNNTDTSFSILSYTDPLSEGNNAEKVFINEAMDIDDFILTTDSTIYTLLQQKQINVILQSKDPKDDGSLSVYAYNKRIPYINVEAEHGHIEEQARMLAALKDIIELFK